LVIWKSKRIILQKDDWTNDIFIFVGDLCVQIPDHDWKLPKNVTVEQVEIAIPSLIESLMKQDVYSPWKGFAN
jgi:hypothetical protein